MRATDAGPRSSDQVCTTWRIPHQPDPGDRRATVLVLTASGRQLVTEIGSARRADADTYFARLSADDRVCLERILRTLDDEA